MSDDAPGEGRRRGRFWRTHVLHEAGGRVSDRAEEDCEPSCGLLTTSKLYTISADTAFGLSAARAGSYVELRRAG